MITFIRVIRVLFGTAVIDGQKIGILLGVNQRKEMVNAGGSGDEKGSESLKDGLTERHCILDAGRSMNVPEFDAVLEMLHHDASYHLPAGSPG
jgi:hypothetical protein